MKVHLVDGPCQGESEVEGDLLAEGAVFEVECLKGASSVGPGQEVPRAERVTVKYQLTSLGPPAIAKVFQEE